MLSPIAPVGSERIHHKVEGRMIRIMLVILAVTMVTAEAVEDGRKLVEMPPEVQATLRLEMMDHLAAINELIGYIGSSELTRAAEVAEERMGVSSMGKHRQSGMGPGRFMPPEMRAFGMAMHQASSRFAKIAEQGDLQASVAALQEVTATCVACHYTYRVR